MTKTEAEAVLKDCDEYVNLNYSSSEVSLDGKFTAEQLEAILAIMRANESCQTSP